MFFGRKHLHKAPVTLVARWMAAGAARESTAIREEMRAELDRTDWPEVESVMSEAFRLAIAAAYSPKGELLEVPEYVRRVREHYEANCEAGFTQADAETLVRAARGENVSIASEGYSQAIL
ncbi:MAG: hypothetical protein ACRD1R_21395 [Acidobacteriota bacterium]